MTLQKDRCRGRLHTRATQPGGGRKRSGWASPDTRLPNASLASPKIALVPFSSPTGEG